MVANLLKFEINLNRDGNLEYNLNCVKTPELEEVLRKLRLPHYTSEVVKGIKPYFRNIENQMKEIM